jgi:hypothetical protein
VRAYSVVLVVICLALVACGGNGDGGETSSAGSLPVGSEPADLNPDDFVDRIDNPYWPMAPGSRWVFTETDFKGTEERIVVTVTDRKKTITGIEATVVHDVVTEDGELIEDTFDWYAQDKDGNVWYMGEDTTEFENGKPVSKEGSWEAGVDGAEAGILIPANPEVGISYRQEYLKGEAEDAAKVISIDEQVEVPTGKYKGVLMTKDWTPLQPEINEHKFYARGVGPILLIGLSGGNFWQELVSYRNGAS